MHLTSRSESQAEAAQQGHQNLEIAEMLDTVARDSVLAAERNGLLLLSEDQRLR
jgi:hypothetical protein